MAVKINKPLAAGLWFFFVASGLFAQHSVPDDGIFSPFVSHLTAETRNNLVRLNWVDSRDVRGPVYVFRSPRPFTGTSPAEVKSVEIAYGTQTYVDEPDGSGTIYYFVAASDDQGQRYDIFIPYTNTAMAVFSTSPWAEAAPVNQADPVSVRPAETPQAGISGLAARPEGEGVTISFTPGETAKTAVLYRSIYPIRQAQDLFNAVVVKAGVNSPYIDYPVPGIAHYYAIIFEDEIAGGNAPIYPGRNATIQAVETAGRTVPGIRSMPLPSMSVYKAVPGNDFYSEPMTNPAPLSQDTAKALGAVQRAQPVPRLQKRPRVFAKDLETPVGEESALRHIVQGPFVKRDWQTVRDELLHYLSMPRSENAEARARFYLGQAHYFTGRNREALIEFLFVQSRYPDEANEWIEAVLAAISR